METAFYLLRSAALVTVGIVAANVVLESDALRKLSPLVRPLCRASNLPREGAISLFAAFLDPMAGKSVLAGFYQEGKVGERQTIVTLVMSTFPTVVGESLFRAHAPVALVLLGPVVGGIYVALNLLAAFLQSIGALIYARFRFPRQACIEDEQLVAETAERTRQERLKTALKKSTRTLLKVVPFMVVAFLIVDLLFTFELMEQIGIVFTPALRVLDLPGVVITAIVAELAHFSAGYAIVSSLLTKGVVTAEQAIITLLVGSLMTISVTYLKYSLPLYTSLFGKLGVKFTVIMYLISMVTRFFVILLVLVVL
ncbi:MAG: nucleoside recognition protein [Methanomicrobia archaeon]|nr:nucleoside recognition protein [Methanomicrobia archaeon]